MATRRAFQPQGQPGINGPSNLAGTETGMSHGPMMPTTPGVGPRPALMMGGNGQPQNPMHGPIGASPMGQGGGMQGQMPPAMQQRPIVDPFAGGPTSPMNIDSMLSPRMPPPGQQPPQGPMPQGPALMPWGQEAGQYGQAAQGQTDPYGKGGP